MRFGRLGLVGVSVLVLAAAAAGTGMVACGGDASSADVGPVDDAGADEAASSSDASASDATSTDTGGGGDGATDDVAVIDAGADGADASADDASADSGGDGSVDAGPDAADASGCGADDTACVNGGEPGLCKSNACSACADPGDDGACTAAYGGASLCMSGACVPGDCRTGADCVGNANGSLCGVATPNVCGKCTQDGQCGAGQICNTATGACVTASQCGAVSDNGTCPVNGADVCCGGTCIPGNCCSGAPATAFCKTKLSDNAAVCSAHVCTTCNPVSGLVYLVDPVAGDDGAATGSGTSGASVATPSCAFKTLTRALQVIGNAPASGTTIKIVSTGSGVTVSSGETFPIRLPAGLTVTTLGGPVTIKVPAASVGFVLATAGSAIVGASAANAITLDGQGATALDGVVVQTGSTDGTKLGNLIVKSFAGDGILVNQTGRLKVGPGVTATANGTVALRASGLHLTGTARVVVAAGAAEAPISFGANTQHGIFVDGKAGLTLTGVPGAGGSGSVTANGNTYAGLVVAQTPGAGLPENEVTGLVAFANTPGNGIRVMGGSNLKLRGSVALANGGSGILVQTNQTKTARVSTLTGIDLGKVGDPGGNTLQATAGNNPNIQAGVCLALDPTSGTLAARGNVFSGHDCAAAAATLSSAIVCGGQRDLGGIALGNDVDVTQCTH